MVNVTRKAVTVQGYQLTSYTDMAAALNYVSGGNYVGSVSCTKANNVVTWELLIYSLSNNSSQQRGVIGSWVIIENGTVAKIVSDVEFTALYTVP